MPPRKPPVPRITRERDVEQQLAKLPTMERTKLQALWAELFHRPPSVQLRRETLLPILAYRIQEIAYGGFKESTARKLRELAEDCSNGRKPAVQPMIRPKIGTRYIREWEGKLREVTVLEAGYEYENKTYRSLSEIARVITGTKWSGPAFFGYKRPSQNKKVLA
jgi:hypothetical protein